MTDEQKDKQPDPAAGEFLRIEKVSKRFGDVEAVSAIDLTIAEGEFLTLLGPSGCGKSTLLRMIGGFERPSEGRVRLRGLDLTPAPPERRPFNMVFQSYALFPHMSVAENVGYGPRIAGTEAGEVERSVAELLDLVHLGEYADRSVGELSGGQQQRVALARALVNEPEVLLLDEPLGALDLQLRKRLQDELRSIQRRLGTTFIYVTHDQEEALTLSHRVAVMEAGRVVQISDPRDLYERPATKFVAEFVGDTNMVECQVKGGSGGRVEVKFGDRGPFTLSHHGSESLDVGEALAVLRPQHLELAEPGTCPFVGEVTQSLFVGTHVRLEVRLDDGAVLRVNADEEIVGLDGTRIGVRIKPGHGTVVAGSPNDRPSPIEG